MPQKKRGKKFFSATEPLHEPAFSKLEMINSVGTQRLYPLCLDTDTHTSRFRPLSSPRIGQNYTLVTSEVV